MKIKSKFLRLLIIKFDSIFRKFYSFVGFYIIWIFFLKWKIRKEDVNDAKYIWDNIYKSTTLKEYQDNGNPML